MAEKATDGICKVCESPIVEEVITKFSSNAGSPIFGPGSKDQMRTVSKGFHCTGCGLKYKFIPE